MIRLTVVLFVLCVGDCFAWWGNHDHGHGHHSGHHFFHGHGHGCHNHNHDWHWQHDNHFEQLSSAVIQTDQYSQASCKQYSNVNALDVPDFAGHKIVYDVDQCDTKNITVQIKHRVVYMYGQKPGDDASSFYDVRVLPINLLPHESTWTCEGDKLVVQVPYKVATSDVTTPEPCLEANQNVIVVPKVLFHYKYNVPGTY